MRIRQYLSFPVYSGWGHFDTKNAARSETAAGSSGISGVFEHPARTLTARAGRVNAVAVSLSTHKDRYHMWFSAPAANLSALVFQLAAHLKATYPSLLWTAMC